jgi:excisionase family DNA binding protein
MVKPKQPRAGSTPSPANATELLTKEQVADYLQTSRRYVERLIKAGRLRAHKLSGGCVRIRRSTVDALLDGCASVR